MFPSIFIRNTKPSSKAKAEFLTHFCLNLTSRIDRLIETDQNVEKWEVTWSSLNNTFFSEEYDRIKSEYKRAHNVDVLLSGYCILGFLSTGTCKFILVVRKSEEGKDLIEL